MMLRLAIVGAGIGGCSAAHFARSLVSDAEITIFEAQNRVGGRIFSSKIGSATKEMGATFFLPINRNMQALVKTFGLEVERLYPSFGIWDGSRFVFRSSPFPWLTKLRLFLRYRWSTIRLNGLIRRAEERVMKLYEEPERAFTSLEELFVISCLDEWLTRSFEELLLKEKIHPRFIKEILEPFTRLIYCQETDINGFAGLATTIGVAGTPYHIKEGNDSLPKKLTESARAQVKLRHRVTGIIKNPSGTFQVVGEPSFSEEFDAIILAAPVEQLGISFENLDPKLEPRRFQRVYFKTVTGVVNPAYFGLKNPNDLPQIVVTISESTSPFKNFITLGTTEEGQSVYHLTGTQPIPDEALDSVFNLRTKSGDYVLESAYPVLSPVSSFQPIRLDHNFFYINAIESAASTMEASVFGAKNTVLLLVRSLKKEDKTS
jgi:phytoene dehydrogenase-like protein